jgi:hypothetical protein
MRKVTAAMTGSIIFSLIGKMILFQNTIFADIVLTKENSPSKVKKKGPSQNFGFTGDPEAEFRKLPHCKELTNGINYWDQNCQWGILFYYRRKFHR